MVYLFDRSISLSIYSKSMLYRTELFLDCNVWWLLLLHIWKFQWFILNIIAIFPHKYLYVQIRDEDTKILWGHTRSLITDCVFYEVPPTNSTERYLSPPPPYIWNLLLIQRQ